MDKYLDFWNCMAYDTLVAGTPLLAMMPISTPQPVTPLARPSIPTRPLVTISHKNDTQQDYYGYTTI